MTFDVCIVDYGMGNIMSVRRAFELLGQRTIVSNRVEDLRNSKRIVLPGVGAFSAAMENLAKYDLIEALNRQVIEEKKSFLGICLGMQLIMDDSCEGQYARGLGWIPGSVKRLETTEGLRVPHMGWNEVIPVERQYSLYEKLKRPPVYYFVHSYHADCLDAAHIGSTCTYGKTFVSSIQHENIYAVQFHPEKSQRDGIELLKNFIAYSAS